jgi:hypothetical protein
VILPPKRLVLFVEGKGDARAVPILARRVLTSLQAHDALFLDPDLFTVKGIGALVKHNCQKWRDWLEGAGKRPNVGAVLLVLDGDTDRVPRNWSSFLGRYNTNEFCPYRAGAMLAQEARSSRAGEAYSLATFFAMKEFEAWLLGGVESLRGESLAGGRGMVPYDVKPPDFDVEAKRDAKGELCRRVPGYDQSLDQAVLAERVDLALVATRCKSFRRFQSAIARLATSVRTGIPSVSPLLEGLE